MTKVNIYLWVLVAIYSCTPTIKKENQKLVKLIDKKVALIDHYHRVRIIEDDYLNQDSTHKIRGYYRYNQLLKLVAITRTSHFERDDYFYFEDNDIMFSGHMMNFMDNNLAEEFKYYYRDQQIVECLFWRDYYDPTQHFPSEHFTEFEPDIDSLMVAEKSRLNFFIKKLGKEGIEVKWENENIIF